jgi:hypothetical protein
MTLEEFITRYQVYTNENKCELVNCGHPGGDIFCVNECPLHKFKNDQSERCHVVYRRGERILKLMQIEELLK